MQTDVPVIDEAGIQKYLTYLKEQERSEATLQKYAKETNFDKFSDRNKI